MSGDSFWNHVFLEPALPFTCVSCVDVSDLVATRELNEFGGDAEEEDVAERATDVQNRQIE